MYTDDFKHIGQRMPFTVPEGYLEGLQAQIIARAAQPRRPWWHSPLLRWSMAACLACAIAVTIAWNNNTQAAQPVSLDDLQSCFAQMSDADQQAIIDLYADDMLFSENENAVYAEY